MWSNIVVQTHYAGNAGVLYTLRTGEAMYVSFDGKKVVMFSPSMEHEITSKSLRPVGRVASDGHDVWLIYGPDQPRTSPKLQNDYYLVRYGLDGKYKGITQIQHDFMFCCDIVALGNETLLLNGTMLMLNGGPKSDPNDWESYHEMTSIGRYSTDGSHISNFQLSGDSVPKDAQEANKYIAGVFLDRDDYDNVILTKPYAGKAWILRPGNEPQRIDIRKNSDDFYLMSVKIHDGQIAILSKKVGAPTLEILDVYDRNGVLSREYQHTYYDMGSIVADWNPERLLMTEDWEAQNGERLINFVEFLQK